MEHNKMGSINPVKKAGSAFSFNKSIPILLLIVFFLVLAEDSYADLYLLSKTGSIYFNTSDIARMQLSAGGNLTLLGLANLSVPGNIDVGGGYTGGGITLVGVGADRGSVQVGNNILLDGQIVAINDVEINRTFVPVRDSFVTLGNASSRFLDAYVINVKSGNQTLVLNGNVSILGNLSVDGSTLVIDDKNNRVGIGKE